jgi:hypothetical protein
MSCSAKDICFFVVTPDKGSGGEGEGVNAVE